MASWLPFLVSLARLLPVAGFPVRSGLSWLTFRLQTRPWLLCPAGAHPSPAHCRGVGWEPRGSDGTTLAPGSHLEMGEQSADTCFTVSSRIDRSVWLSPNRTRVWGNSESELRVPREIAGRSGQESAALLGTAQC